MEKTYDCAIKQSDGSAGSRPLICLNFWSRHTCFPRTVCDKIPLGFLLIDLVIHLMLIHFPGFQISLLYHVYCTSVLLMVFAC